MQTFLPNFALLLRGKVAFAHSLDELKPKSPGLTEAGFNFYDGIHRPFDRKDVANTLKWHIGIAAGAILCLSGSMTCRGTSS